MLNKKQKSYCSTLPNEPIGILPDGTINIVAIDDPPFRPRVLDDLGEDFDPGLIDSQIGSRATKAD